MVVRPLLAPLTRLALVALLGVASGTLECGGAPVTVKELRGDLLYHRMCAVCHGASGQGYAADQAPSLTRGDFLAAVDDAYLRSGHRWTDAAARPCRRGRRAGAAR